MKLKVQEVTKENFAHIGQVIQTPDIEHTPPQLTGDGFVHHAELAFIETKGPLEFGITTFNKRPMKTRQLEQHAQTQEMLLAMDAPFVMPVAPKKVVDGREVPDLTQLMAICVKQGEGVIFHKGNFHWAPFTLGERSSVLVGFEPKTWADDIIICDLDEEIELEI